jgi:hypothetical protein
MPRGHCTFRQRDATALLKAARDAGYARARLVIQPNKMTLETALKTLAGAPGEPEPVDGGGENEWDVVLNGPNTPRAS